MLSSPLIFSSLRRVYRCLVAIRLRLLSLVAVRRLSSLLLYSLISRDPELNRLNNDVRDKDRELSESHAEIKAFKLYDLLVGEFLPNDFELGGKRTTKICNCICIFCLQIVL